METLGVGSSFASHSHPSSSLRLSPSSFFIPLLCRFFTLRFFGSFCARPECEVHLERPPGIKRRGGKIPQIGLVVLAGSSLTARGRKKGGRLAGENPVLRDDSLFVSEVGSFVVVFVVYRLSVFVQEEHPTRGRTIRITIGLLRGLL